MSEEVEVSKKELKKQEKLKKRQEKKQRQLLTVSDVCKGCGTQMALDQRFCSGCGAKRIYNRLNWRNLTEDFVDRFLNVENNFLQTFIGLSKRPEDVINGYINGLRKKYLSAFSYFAISITLAGVYMFIMRTWYLDEAFLEQSMSVTNPNVKGTDITYLKDFMDVFFDYQSVFTFLSIPLLAIISKLVFWNYKQYNFIEHVVIYLYAYSHYQIISSILGIFLYWSASMQMILSALVSLGMLVYMAFVLMKVFGLTIEKILIKTLLFFVVSGVFMFIISMLAGLVGVYLAKSGALDGIEIYDSFKTAIKKQAEFQKAAKAARDSISMDTIKQMVPKIKDTLQLLGT